MRDIGFLLRDGEFRVNHPESQERHLTKTIQCYYSTEKPDRAYEVIGHVEASGFVFSSNKQLVYALQKQAQKQQADAIVNVRFSYIPALLIGIPYAEGDLVKYK